MNDPDRSDDWRALCELAAKEKDPQKLLSLISRISRALEECSQQGQKHAASIKVTDLEKEDSRCQTGLTADPERNAKRSTSGY